MHAARRCFHACPKAICSNLPDLITARPRWPDRDPSAARQALQARFAKPKDWGRHAIIAHLNAMTLPETVVSVESGAHRFLLSQKWKAGLPLTLLQSARLCTMAAALPLAIGAALARPGDHTVAVMGDGGLEISAGELATLRDPGLPVTVGLMQDQCLALIALKPAQVGLIAAGVTLGQTDFAALARSFSGSGATMCDAPALQHELAGAALRPGFSLIACRFDADDYRNSL